MGKQHLQDLMGYLSSSCANIVGAISNGGFVVLPK